MLLRELEGEGHTVIPTARAARLTMDREGIRRLAAEELGLETPDASALLSLSPRPAPISGNHE